MTEDELSNAVNKALVDLSMSDQFAGVFFHVANEVQPPGMKPHQAKRYWDKRTKIGVKKGAPDWVIAWDGGFGFIELKRPATYKTSDKTGKQIIGKPKGRQSPEQEQFQFLCDANNIPYKVCHSVDDVLCALDEWRAI